MMRRRFLVAATGLLLLPPRLARATPAEVAEAIRAAVGDAAQLRPGRVRLDVPVMVENGNSVAMTVSCDALPGEVKAFHVFAEGNPLPNVTHVRFGPAIGRPRISTRIRLATSETVIAVAEMADGTCWTDSVDLVVTLAACLE
jgi:sulfur-oxidizing protein SoxY